MNNQLCLVNNLALNPCLSIIALSLYLLYNEMNYHFGGEDMENLGSTGIFFGGLGLLLLSFGLFWFVDVYKKSKMSKHKEEK